MTLKTYQVFYHFYGSGDSVASEFPITMNEADCTGQAAQDTFI